MKNNLFFCLFVSVFLIACASESKIQNKNGSTPVLTEQDNPASLYEILGMLSEYCGRLSNIDLSLNPHFADYVERFFINETDCEAHFKKLIKEYEKEVNQNFNIKGEMSITSRKFADLLNSFYVENKYGIRTLSPKLILEASEDNQIAYIKGVYRRFGKKNSIKLVNAPDKLDLVALTLKRLGCSDIKRYRTEARIPNSFIVIFKPSNKIKTALGLTGNENEKLKNIFKEY